MIILKTWLLLYIKDITCKTGYIDHCKSYHCISKLCQEVADIVEVDHLLQTLQLFGIPWHKYPQ